MAILPLLLRFQGRLGALVSLVGIAFEWSELAIGVRW
jgi:hypothetical protein